MRRYLLLAIVAIAAACAVTWQVRAAMQRQRNTLVGQRDAQWMATYQQASQAYASANYSEAVRILLTILPNAENWYSRDKRLPDALSLLGNSYSADHNIQQAEPIFNRTLQLYGSLLLGDSAEMGRVKLDLANIYRDQGLYDKAEQSYSEAFAILEKNPPLATGYDRGGALLNLGYIRELQGRYPEAEEFLRRSIATYGPYGAFAQHDLASALLHLADVYDFELRYPEAEAQYLKALAIQEKISGPGSAEAGQTLTRLALVYTSLGQTSKANELLNRAQEIAQHLSAPGGHPNGLLLDDLGAVAERRGKYAKAEAFYQKSINAYETTDGPEARDLAVPLAQLARLYRDEQQFDIRKAEPLLKHALSIREKSLGKEHPETASLLSDLSLLYFYEHRFNEAEDFAERALPIQEKAYGSQSLEVSTTLNRLGIAERDERKLMQAESALKRALAIREKRLPASHTWLAISLENLASVYVAQGQMDKATPLVIRAQAIRAHSAGG